MDELRRAHTNCIATPYDKRIIHTQTGLEFYVEGFRGSTVVLASQGDFRLKWSGSPFQKGLDINVYFHLEEFLP